MEKKQIHIGTSGWHYDHWQGTFYPEDTKKERFLEYYIKYFNTVEINNTFYQMPNPKTLKTWRDITRGKFIFAVKASRYITHMKKLKDPEKPVSRFFERISALGTKLKPVLFQLPPRWRVNAQRLESFLSVLPRKYKYAFEFRDPTWFSKDVYRILSNNNAAFCIYDLDGRPSPKEITADFVYIRLHGPDGPYQGKYSKKKLAGWVGAFSAWLRKVKDIYCYFDNDQAGYAAENALEIKKMIQ